MSLETNRNRGFGVIRMKRTLQTLLVISFIAMFITSPVTAVTSEGLTWGVALNDEFTFQYEVVE